MVLAERASIRCISNFVRNGKLCTARPSTCSAVTRGGSTNGSLATQFSPHRPYFDPSVATSTFMARILPFEFLSLQFTLLKPTLKGLRRQPDKGCIAAQCHRILEV